MEDNELIRTTSAAMALAAVFGCTDTPQTASTGANAHSANRESLMASPFPP
jgi:hypothetical protein